MMDRRKFLSALGLVALMPAKMPPTMVASVSDRILTSADDGKTWVSHSRPANSQWYGISWDDEVGLAVVRYVP